jgi:hypothetical protein
VLREIAQAVAPWAVRVCMIAWTEVKAPAVWATVNTKARKRFLRFLT